MEINSIIIILYQFAYYTCVILSVCLINEESNKVFCIYIHGRQTTQMLQFKQKNNTWHGHTEVFQAFCCWSIPSGFFLGCFNFRSQKSQHLWFTNSGDFFQMEVSYLDPWKDHGKPQWVGSLNRWDRYHIIPRKGSIYHLYTTYSPCLLDDYIWPTTY